MTSTTLKASGVAPGDQIISPFSGRKMLVRSIETAPLGMLDFHCLDGSGERKTLTLDADEDIQISSYTDWR